uniref:Phospholipid-transporting ATPase n=1 Tax=Oryzias melastigma TaxID=30732 RepID=A0A3B3BJ36_ORYME
MESFHWVQHRCRQLLSTDSSRGWYSAPAGSANKSSSQGPSGKRRTVFACHALESYKSNTIRTTKYSFLSFLPKNLFEQLHRFANVYFIFLAALNFVPAVEAFQPEVSLIPIVLVLSVTAIKDVFEDFRRFHSDRLVNRQLCDVYSSLQKDYVDRCWKDVRVGDFVRLSCNEIIPADMLLLYSSDPRGVCYIETANLDGETNLKQRQMVSDLPMQDSEFSPENFHSRIECENPNNDLSRFRGFIEHSSGVRVGLHSSNLLLRSCTIRNTETVIGIVVYAGHETKAMMNNSGPRYKRSLLERRLNTDILWCVFLLLVMCLIAAVGHGLWLKDLKDPIFQVDGETSPALAAFYVFWTMIIVLQVLIPISLYVSIEIVKLGQIYFIHNDLDLYNEEQDSRIQCRALNITEDLGQIQYVFSDKTGTLTENKMVFRRCSIFGVDYPHEENARRLEVYEEDPNKATSRTVTLKSACSRKSLTCRSLSCNRSSVSLHTLTAESEEDDQLSSHPQAKTGAFCSPMAKDVVPDPALEKKLNSLRSPLLHLSDGLFKTTSNLELTYITDFFLALTICNTVVVSSPGQPRHVARTPLKSLEEIKLMFQRLSFSPFTTPQMKSSPRSFTSRLFTRGKTGSLTFPTPNNNTSDCPNSGPESYEETSSLKVELDDEDDSLGEDSEDELLYEAESPDEAALVHAARAYHCTLRARSPENLLVELPGIGSLPVRLLHVLPFDSNRKRMSVVVRHPLTGEVVVYTKGADSVIMDLAERPKGKDPSSARCPNSFLEPPWLQVFLLLLKGAEHAQELYNDLRSSFLELSRKCKAVLCCRSTPLQKSKVVQLVRDQLEVMTLAVGDGANDVSMIQVADVGIGISGQEGMQVTTTWGCAFFNPSTPEALKSYRIFNILLFSSLANVSMYVNLLFWYQFFCGFSGNVMINSWVLILFNLLFTSVPPLVYGVLDQDTAADALLELTQLYDPQVYVPSIFWITVLDAFYQSCICFFIPYFALAGSDVGSLSFGSPINTSALFIILLHQVIESHTLTWIHALVLFLSAASYFAFVLLFSTFCTVCSHPTNLLGVEPRQLSTPLFYIICAVTTVTALMPRYISLNFICFYHAFSNTRCL